MKHALALLLLVPVAGCSILIDSSELMGGTGGTDAGPGGVDGGTDAGVDPLDDGGLDASAIDGGDCSPACAVGEVCGAFGCVPEDPCDLQSTPADCVMGNCCDCDGDFSPLPHHMCAAVGDMVDCADEDPLVFPGAAPDCATDAADDCDWAITRDFRESVQETLGFREVGLILADQVPDGSGDPVTVTTTSPQVSISRGTVTMLPGETRDGAVFYVSGEPGSGVRARLAQYDVQRGVDRQRDLDFVVPAVAFSYTEAHAFSVGPTGRIVAALLDGDLVLFQPRAGAGLMEVIRTTPGGTGASFPIAAIEPAGAPRSAFYRQGREAHLHGLGGASTRTSTSLDVPSSRGGLLRAADRMAILRSLSNLNALRLWEGLGSGLVTRDFSAPRAGRPDITSLAPAGMNAREYFIVAPLVNGTAASLAYMHVECTGTATNTCGQSIVMGPPARIGRPAAVGAFRAPALADAVVAVVGAHAAGAGTGNQLMIRFVRRDGSAVTEIDPQLLINAAELELPTLTIRDIDVVVQEGGGNVDIMIAMAGGDASTMDNRIAITGVRLCGAM